MVVITGMSVDDGCAGDSVSSTSYLPMTQEQKDWLMAAIDCDQPKMTSLLNQHPELAGWKININGYTALHYAAKYGDCAIIRLLLGNYQASVDAQTYEGLTPLHLAAFSGNEDVIVLLTSMYKARTDIRDYRGQLPGAYLPKEKEALAKYFPNPLRTLLQNRNNYLYLLVNQPETNQSHPNSVPYENSSKDECSESESIFSLTPSSLLPIAAQFPWNQASQNHIEESHQKSSFSRSVGSIHQVGSDTAKDRYKMNKYSAPGLPSRMGCTPVDLKGLNMNLKGPSLKLRCDSNFNYSDVDLIQNIYTHIRQKHELPRPYNPLNPESTKASDASKNTYRFATGSLRSTVGRHLKRNTCSAYGSLRHTSSSLTGSSNNIDSDDFTDPPTPTNELNEEKQQN